jgi:hypothetical protein
MPLKPTALPPTFFESVHEALVDFAREHHLRDLDRRFVVTRRPPTNTLSLPSFFSVR